MTTTRHFELGWGIAGRTARMAKSFAREHGCALKQEPSFLSLRPIQAVTFTVDGGDESAWAAAMDRFAALSAESSDE